MTRKPIVFALALALLLSPALAASATADVAAGGGAQPLPPLPPPPASAITPPAAGRPGEVYQIGLIGDLLYTAEEVAKYPALMADLDAAPLAFVIHDGDFKSGSTLCDDATFQNRLELFQTSAHPLIFVPGDNEWTDCHRENNGGYDPLERLDALRRGFFSGDASLGQRKLALQRQSEDRQYAPYREHARWSWGDAMFVTLNVQGSNNNLGRTPQMDAEYQARNAAVLAWMRESFVLARRAGLKGLMLVIQADPTFEEPAERRTGFNDFLAALEAETLDFPGQVVLVHGDTHYYRIDKPLLGAASGRRIENFTRVETFGTPDVHWVRATIDPADPNLFRFEPVLVKANLVDHRAGG